MRGQTTAKVNQNGDAPLRTISRRTWWGLRRHVVLDDAVCDRLNEAFSERDLLDLDRVLDAASLIVDRPRRRTYRLRDGDVHLIVKFEFFPFPNWLVTLPRSPIGMRELKNLRILERLGARAFTPVLAGDVSWGPFFFQSWIATREVPGGCAMIQDAGGKGFRGTKFSKRFRGLYRHSPRFTIRAFIAVVRSPRTSTCVATTVRLFSTCTTFLARTTGRASIPSDAPRTMWPASIAGHCAG